MSILSHQIEESILIDAPPTVVWAILTDLPGWTDWNTFAIKAEVVAGGPGQRANARAPLAVGSHQLLTVMSQHRLRPGAPGDSAKGYGELRWGGQWLHPLVLDTKHWCLLEPEGEDGGQTLFTQGELFTGLVVPVSRALGTLDELQAGYVRMNEDLRRRAEGDRRE
ncbi:hypothetical protein PG991_010207 [Apiospora marii]|uniref:SRPBCC domain-containing protein n=1 Tax=Apiospora marii TaxID=335849 RepID=A0ABR1RIR7_9PEZI